MERFQKIVPTTEQENLYAQANEAWAKHKGAYYRKINFIPLTVRPELLLFATTNEPTLSPYGTCFRKEIHNPKPPFQILECLRVQYDGEDFLVSKHGDFFGVEKP